MRYFTSDLRETFVLPLKEEKFKVKIHHGKIQ